jgi:hypothetical protein
MAVMQFSSSSLVFLAAVAPLGKAFGLPTPSGNMPSAFGSSTSTDTCARAFTGCEGVAISSSEGVEQTRAEQDWQGVRYLRRGILGVSGGGVDMRVLLVLGGGLHIEHVSIAHSDGGTGAALPQVLLRVGIKGHIHDSCCSNKRIHAAPRACDEAQERLFR